VRRRIAIVSDLHMTDGAGPRPDPFGEDEAFAELVDGLASDRTPMRLVLLGDTFDFVLSGTPSSSRRAADTAAARRSLDAIAAAHPRVFGALGRYARNEHVLVIVPGDRDLELLARPVQQHLRNLFWRAARGGDSASRVTFASWMLHVPGVVYAEHGQQHHARSHVGQLVAPGGAGVRRPFAVCFDEARADLPLLRARGAPAGEILRRGAVHAARFGGACGRLAVPQATRMRPEFAHRHAEAVGLPAGALIAVDRGSTPSLLSIAARGARAIADRAGGADASMVGAARMVADALACAGTPAPFLVFGHTHAAADLRLGAGPAPRYLNAGTWSTLVRPGRDATVDRLRCVQIEYGGGEAPRAWLARGMGVAS
jgi:UDP-2,3-diacylglucosamine pyrophosphatase LpxH